MQFNSELYQLNKEKVAHTAKQMTEYRSVW